MISLTQGFAKTLAPEVTVNAIAPGPDAPAGRRDEGAGRGGGRDHPAEALGRPAATSRTQSCTWPGAPYVTGVVLPVDGGRSIV